MKRALIIISAFVMLFSFSITVYANSSPTAEFSTDSTELLVSDADSSIPAIRQLLDGKPPKDVLKDDSLDGYSTLGVFSVTAVPGFDFTNEVTTDIKAAGLTEDMEVEVKLLDADSNWCDVSYSVSNGLVSAAFTKEGQVAVFVQESVDLDDTEAPTTEEATEGEEVTTESPDDYDNPGGSPQTGDNIYIIFGLAFVAIAGVCVSIKKMTKQ